MKIIVISITPWKDNDAIINAVSKNGMISFQAKGLLNSKCKNLPLNNPLTYAEISFIEGNYKYPILKNCQILSTPMQAKMDLDYLGCISLIDEATRTLLQEDESLGVYELLLNTLDELKKPEFMWSATLKYLFALVSKTGFEFSSNSCAVCGLKDNLLDFSFENGGFCCNKCIGEFSVNKFNKNQINLIKDAIDNVDCIISNKSDTLPIIKSFSYFIKDEYGIDLKSIKLINN